MPVITADFSVTAAFRTPGDILDCRLSVAGTDSSTGTAVLAQITQVAFLLDIKG